MVDYVLEGEAIEGLRIYCEFEKRPSFIIDENSNETFCSITGNPALATISITWKLNK